MEEIINFEGITHKLDIPEQVSGSVHFAILAGFMAQTCILISSGDKNSKSLILNLIKQRLPTRLNDMQNILKRLKQLTISTFPEIIPQLLSIQNIFLEARVIFTDTPKDSQLYLLSKALDLMIIIKQKPNPDKHYCCTYNIQPIKLIIIEENNNFFPAFNLDEIAPKNVFYKYPRSSGTENLNILKLFYKIFKKIEDFIPLAEKKSLMNIVKKNSGDSLDTKTKDKLIYELENPSPCESHNKVIFPCGSKHCKECSKKLLIGQGMMKCPCGFEFSQTLVLQLTTLAPTAYVNLITAPSQILNSNSTSDTLSTDKSLRTINVKKDQPNTGSICWGCNQTLYGECSQTCPDHLICSKCAERALKHGYICVMCPLCNTHAFAPDAVIFNNTYYHLSCFNSQNMVFQQSNIVTCWGCHQEYPFENCGRCEDLHSICPNCYIQMDNYCSPCHGLYCLSCDNYIFKNEACVKDNIYYHRRCVEISLNISINNLYS